MRRERVDAIAFRDFWCRYYNPRIGRTIRRFANSLGKEVWVPCYMTMSSCNLNDTYLKAVEQDEDVTGVLFYETCENYVEKSGRFEWLPEKGEIIKRFMERNK